MGLFDLPTPLFNLLDGLISFIPELFRLIIWGLIAGYGSMWLFKRCSNQAKIQGLKQQVKANQKLMASFEGEMGELMPLVGTTLKLAFKQLGAALGPALLVSIPVIFMLAWLSNSYGLVQPNAGENYLAETQTTIESGFDPNDYQWENTERVRWGNDDQTWGFVWPEADQELKLNRGDINIFSISATNISPVIHKKQWWNWLIANPMGYLPADSKMELMRFNFQQNKIQEMGPTWMHGWMFTFFMSFLVFSLAFKFILKIA